MKLQVIKNPSERIEGFTNITVQDVASGLDAIMDNECTDIIIGDNLKLVPEPLIEKVILGLIKKLRMDGVIKISGFDLRQMSLGVVNNTVSVRDYNKVVSECHSIVSNTYIVDILRKYNLKIETVELEGLKYDITAIRKN